LLVNPGEFDFHLMEGSPCIDAGVDAGAPTTDIEGNPRLGQADIGAFEWDGTSSIQNIEGLGTLSVFPNPVVENLHFNFTSELQGEVKMSITDLRGRIHRIEELNKGDYLLDAIFNVSELAGGIYYLNITMDNNSISTRFMVL